VGIDRERVTGRYVGDARQRPSAQQLLHNSMRVAEESSALTDWKIQNKCVDEAMPLVVTTVAALARQIATVVGRAEVIGRAKERRRIVDAVAPGVRAVHRQQIVQQHLSGDNQTVESRITEVAGDGRTRPLWEWEDLLVRRLRPAEALVLDDHVRLVVVDVDT